jgi:hypothetical protein
VNTVRAAATGVTAALVCAGLLAGPSAQAALDSGGSADSRTALTAHSARRPLDFAVPGVVIWSAPRSGSARNGLGYPGQGLDSQRLERHEHYTCDMGASDLWHFGRNMTTGVSGWVPACNTADPD